MTRTNTQTRNPDQRIFASPVVLAFVRIVTERRGISEAQGSDFSSGWPSLQGHKMAR
jgi:hypothetical protein